MSYHKPTYLTELFPVLDQRLIDLLRHLSPEDWQRPTICRGWSVKDIASHLLDGNFRRIALNRDGYQASEMPAINSYRDLIDYLNQLNADWVRATKRLSSLLLIELLEQTGKQVYDEFLKLPPHEKAIFPVGWAGEETSENWFDIAREYTERWHHQQQIRLAVDQPGDLMDHAFYYPLLDTFMRALPHTYRNTAAPTGAIIRVAVTGEGGGDWYLLRHPDAWQLTDGTNVSHQIASVTIDGSIAWRLFTKGISQADAQAHVRYEGNHQLAAVLMNMIAVMA